MKMKAKGDVRRRKTKKSSTRGRKGMNDQGKMEVTQ